jgi:hypothetical protein
MRYATYLRNRTGWPHIQFQYGSGPADGDVRGFSMPFDITLRWTTCRDSRHAISVAQAEKDTKGIPAVLYAWNIDDLEDAVVVMPVRAYTTLITGYINSAHEAQKGTE